MTEPLRDFSAWKEGLERLGYTLAKTSPQGSALFVCEGKPSRRLSAYEPNEATALWMKRLSVIDCRCLVDAFEPARIYLMDMPEFGLEIVDDYHSDLSAITKSMLAVFMGSPVEYHATYILGTMERKKATEPMKLGAICHAMLLEHKRLDETAIQYPYSCFTDSGRLKTKEADAFAKRVAPLIAVKEDVLTVAAQVCEKARASEFGRLFDIHGDNMKFETRVDAELFGLPCKCKPDLHIVTADTIIVPDLKFGAFKQDDWRRSSSRFFYWMQQTHYSAILESHYGLPVSWSFWAGETKPPFRFGPKDYDLRSIEMAREKHKQLIGELKTCYETNVWQDKFETTLTLAPWDLGDAFEEASTVDWSDSDG